MKTLATAILGITIITCGLSTLGFSQTHETSKAPAATTQPQVKPDLADNTIRSLYEQHLELKRQIAAMKARGLGDEHPSLVAMRRYLESMKEELDEAVVNLRKRPQVESKNLTCGEESPKAAIEKKLKTIMIPRLHFEDTTFREAIEFLRLRATELDTAELDPEKKGINFVLKIPEGKPMPKIAELQLRNVPVGVALKYMCEIAGLQYQVEEFAVTISKQEAGNVIKKPFAIVIPRTDKPEVAYPLANPVPGKKGFVFSPYKNNSTDVVDVSDIPSGTLVMDPFYPHSEKNISASPKGGAEKHLRPHRA